MTFQRECERQDRPKCPIKYTKAAKSSESIAQQTAQTLAETNAPPDVTSTKGGSGQRKGEHMMCSSYKRRGNVIRTDILDIH